jgi:hypothetical protein
MRRQSLQLALIILPFLFLLPACGGDDGATPQDTPPEALAQGVVDNNGGLIGDDTAMLTVPRNAFDQAVNLALFEDDSEGPFPDPEARALRIEGIPYQLGAPLELRFQHGFTLEPGDSLAVFLGEEREAYSGGGGLCWHPIAGRDSAGWCVVNLDRGALPLANKSAAAVKVITSSDVAIADYEGGHIRVIYRSSEVQPQAAANLVTNFETAYSAMEGWGFTFGQAEGYWPRDVVVCEPPGSWACFIPGPGARGHFEIDPAYVQPDINLLPVAVHEFFHLVQTFYDPRDPEEWGSLNQERLWLDEATAAWLETTAIDVPGYYPQGLDGDNLTALLYGFHGSELLETAQYGYGMSPFIRYLVEDTENGQGEDRILSLFAHFKEHGDATDALEAVWNPAPTQWCLDMQRKLLAMEIYPYDTEGVVWWAWPWDGFLGSELGSEQSTTKTVADLGGALCKFTIEGDEPASTSALKIRAMQADPGQPAEHLPLTVYGRPVDQYMELLATGTDSLTIDDWPALYATYSDILILATRPFITAPGLEGTRDVEISAEVVFDGSAINLAQFNRVTVEVKTDNLFTNASGVFYNDIISVIAPVSWTGSGFYTTTASDTFAIAVDPEALTVGSWYASEHGETIGGSYFVRRLGGTLAYFESYDGTSIVFSVRGMETCDRLTHVFESMARDEETAPYSYLLSYSCHDGGNLYDQSKIYLHFYHLP